MNKGKMIALLVEKMGMPKTQATEVVEILLSSMVASVKQGEEVVLQGLGTLKPVRRSSKVRKSFGKQIEIKNDYKIHFRVSKTLELKAANAMESMELMILQKIQEQNKV